MKKYNNAKRVKFIINFKKLQIMENEFLSQILNADDDLDENENWEDENEDEAEDDDAEEGDDEIAEE